MSKERPFPTIFADVFEFPQREANSVTLSDIQDGTYRNPIALALEWRELIAYGMFCSKSELARHLGVCWYRIFSVMSLLRLKPDIQQTLLKLGDPLQGPIITVNSLGDIARGNVEKQEGEVEALLKKKEIEYQSLKTIRPMVHRKTTLTPSYLR